MSAAELKTRRSTSSSSPWGRRSAHRPEDPARSRDCGASGCVGAHNERGEEHCAEIEARCEERDQAGERPGLFIVYPSLRTPYALPELKLVLWTIFTLAAALIALLSGTRFAVEGRRFDLFLSCGFFTTLSTAHTTGQAARHARVSPAAARRGARSPAACHAMNDRRPR